MAWRYRKRLKIIPGVHLNLSKSGVSATIGVRGMSVTYGNKGTYANIGIPGTGMFAPHWCRLTCPPCSKSGIKACSISNERQFA